MISSDNAKAIAILAGVGAVAFVGYKIWSNRAAIGAAVNPADPNNIAATAANSVTRTLTDGREETLGGWLASIFDPATRAANRMVREMTTPSQAPPRAIAAYPEPVQIREANRQPVSLGADVAILINESDVVSPGPFNLSELNAP